MELKVGAYFIHGFLGYPTDFGDLSSELEKLNIDTRMIILPGHGNGENTALYSWRDWIEFAESHYLEFKNKFDVIYLIGFSMGGTIASYLASKHGCDKLVLIAPAFEYLNPLQQAKDLKLAFQKRIFKINEIKKMLIDHYGYHNGERKVKVKTFLDFITLTKYCVRNLGCIKMPLRIYHGNDDEIVPVKSSIKAIQRFHSQDKKLEIIPYGRHMLMTGPDGKNVEKMISEFLSMVPDKEETLLVS